MGAVHIVKDFAGKRVVMEKTLMSDRRRVWKAWTTASDLEKWWGPKEWPASSKSFDFRVGGHWHYYMTGPDGTKAWGRIDYTSVEELESFTGIDFFTDESGAKNAELPSTFWSVKFLDAAADTTKVIVESRYATEEDLGRIVDMGFEAGFTSALENLDELLISNPT